jgi:hypothetical protein
MKGYRRGLSVFIAVLLVIVGLWSSLAALLFLVVFAEGNMGPRSLAPDEKAQRRFEGRLYATGAAASFVGAVGVLWWGFHRRPRDTEPVVPKERDEGRMPC